MYKPFLIVHGEGTTFIIGTFVFHTLLEACFINTTPKDRTMFSETTIILLLGLPYIIDFICGCFRFRFMLWIVELEEERE